MNVVALVKYIPNPTGVPEMGQDFRLKREGVEGALDPGDEHGVEAALQLAESSGGEVTYVSMGPEPAMAAIRKALSMGGDKGVLVTDGALKGADALAIVTEWNEFRRPDFARMRTLMRSPVIFDGRNLFTPEQMKQNGFTYYSIGRH